MTEDSNEFYWDTVFVKVEDKLFCVPRCEFVQSSEVFADMFLLPSGPATHVEGQDKDHPIVLEGYKKNEFTCLLKVMYPTATSLISGSELELNLKKEEWVSVLKISTIWNMTKIRQYAIHRLSTGVTLLPIEKLLLARAHRVGRWLNEAVISLVRDPMPTLEDLATLGWETVSRILWIRANLPGNAQNMHRIRRNAIKCPNCSSSSILINANCGCRHTHSGDSELTFSGSTSVISGTNELSIPLGEMQCLICMMNINNIRCNFCSDYSNKNTTVRVTVVAQIQSESKMIEEMFGEEIVDYGDSEPSTACRWNLGV